MRLITMLTLLLVVFASLAIAEPRIALVIGNSDYQSVSSLDNADNDAELMKASLEEVGFSVTLLINSTQEELKRGAAEFGRTLRAAGPDATGLFYYAGHGVQSFGANYLLPVDAELNNAADLDLVAMDASSILRQMASARNRTNIVILDACRDNPFETIPELNDNGLAEMNAPTGTFLAYATAPGAVALDGVDGNSPFTKSLAQNISLIGQPIEQVMKAVRVEVIEETDGRQTPWDTSSLVANFIFNPAEALTGEQVAEQQLWESVEASGDSVQLMLFMRSYPNGRFFSEARSLLSDAIESELVPSVAPEVLPVPDPAPETAVIGNADLEIALMETAQASGLLSDYEAYLEAFPNGLFAELIKIEIANLQSQEIAVALLEVVEVPEQPTSLDFFYDQVILNGSEVIRGLTIEEAILGTPLFAPVEGVPDELWQGQECSSCHQWTREALCSQGQTYMSETAAAVLEKDHPLGGTFKNVLRQWAQNDCQ
jgi:uncharacterized caspase-like protein